METPTRQLYWNIDAHWIMYLLFAVVVGVFALFFYRRYRLWKLGAPEELEGSKGKRFWGAFGEVLSQKRVLKEKGPGLMHLAIFWCMLFCIAATTIVALQADLGIQLMYGDFYLYFMSLAIDCAGFVGIVGVVVALVRRASKANPNLTTEPMDIFILVLLLLILVTGFMTEGLRIQGTSDPWAMWSPVGYAFSLMFAALPAEVVLAFHRAQWWIHLCLAFLFLGSFTYHKMVHAIFIPGNIYFRSFKPKGTIEPIDFEDENLESMGVRVLEEYTWKDLYDSQSCIKCGRCQANCPAYLSQKDLSPKAFIKGIREASEERGAVLLATTEDNRTEEQTALIEQPVVGTVLSEDALWQCTTCRSCVEQCPARIDHPTKITKLRTYQVSMESAFPTEAQSAFRGMETNGNPWGLGWQKRTDWTQDLDFEVPTLSDNPTAEYLYWPGCAAAYDSRNQKIARAFVTLLHKAGVDFAIIGNEEKCCGDSARRLGNEYVYFMLASENIGTLNSYGVKKIVTTCPHCLHALSVDYPQMGGHFEVLHHSQLLAQLISSGALNCGKSSISSVTYHDSCYLGRYHDIFEQPRNVLQAAGLEVSEMDRHHAKSFCCGAGGGHMWLEEKAGNRINNERAAQALAKSTEAIATGCPFCLTMLKDGVAANEATTPVKDISELLLEAVE